MGTVDCGLWIVDMICELWTVDMICRLWNYGTVELCMPQTQASLAKTSRVGRLVSKYLVLNIDAALHCIVYHLSEGPENASDIGGSSRRAR